MTMHLLPAYYTTTKTSKNRSKPKTAAQIKHEKWLAKQGLLPEQIKGKKKLDADWKKQYTNTMVKETKEMVGDSTSTAKRGVMENLHKESKEVQKMILIKASRVMPLYNKGGLQYASPEEDMTQVGTKSRR
jgi:hypothetical protein